MDEQSSTYVSYDNVDCDVILPPHRIGRKNKEKIAVKKSKSSIEVGKLNERERSLNEDISNNKESENRLNQVNDARKNFETRNTERRRTSLSENVSSSVRRLSRGFSVHVLKTRRSIKDLKKTKKQLSLEGSVAPSMSKSNDLHLTDGKTKRTKSLNEKNKTSLNNPGSVSTQSVSWKNLGKISIPKILGGNKYPSAAGKSTSNESVSGILKIYVGSLSLGSNYKSLMITSKTSSKNVLRLVLERYHIPPSTVDRYVLCEVTGKIMKDDKNQLTKAKSLNEILECDSSHWFDDDFVEDYIRPLSDSEQPLLLQSRWKQEKGALKRFEVRKKSEIFKKRNKNPTATKSLDRLESLSFRNDFNLRTFSLHHQKEIVSENEKVASLDACCTFDKFKSSLQLKEEKEKAAKDRLIHKNKSENAKENYSTPKVSVRKWILSDERITPDGSSDSYSASVDKPSSSTPSPPYMLTLQGNEEILIHFLKSPETLIGNDVTDFKLVASDILRHHCVIHRDLEVLFSDADNSDVHNHWCVTLTPLNSGAKVWINGMRVYSKSQMQHSDLVSIGKHHLFMYKDPLHHVASVNRGTIRYPSLSSGSIKESEKSSGPTCASNTSSTSTNTPQPHTTHRTIKTCVKYPLEHEEDILSLIFTSFRVWEAFPVHLPTSPAIIVSQCVIHSFLNFKPEDKSTLLEKICNRLHSAVKDVTAKLSHREDCASNNKSGAIDEILSPLHPVTFWIANSMEILNFLQHDLSRIIRKRVKRERKRGLLDADYLNEVENFEVDDVVFKSFEEVITSAVQNLVYFIQKVLRQYLPAILACNPFVNHPPPDDDVTRITDTMTYLLETLRKYDIKQRVIEQLMSHLFNFTSVFLFNILMDKESAVQYYRWEAGIKIRGNLDRIEAWAVEHGYAAQSTSQLAKLSALASLLATPRDQLLKSFWSSLRTSFLPLSPAQLNRVLNGYQAPGNKIKLAWQAMTHQEKEECDVENTDTDAVMESCNRVPPFVISISSSSIIHKTLPDDPYLQNICVRIKKFRFLKEDLSTSPFRGALREQPDGRENSFNEMTSSIGKLSKENDVTGESETSSILDLLPKVTSPRGSRKCLEGRDSPQSSRVNITWRGSTPTSETTYALPQDTPTHGRTNKRSRKGENRAMLNLSKENETQSLSPSLSSDNERKNNSPSSCSSDAPKDIEIVNLSRCQDGLGVGFVDGMDTAVESAGLYIRFIIPKNTTDNNFQIKHHDLLRCRPLDGKLLVGDRVLAVNGVSLLKMTYQESIATLQQSSDDVRLLVKRAGLNVAMKILLSSK